MTIATSLALALTAVTACSDDADIGVDSQPVTCAEVGGAEVNGRILVPATTGAPEREVVFGDTTPSVAQTTGGANYTLFLAASEVILTIGFQCGNAELASYDVVEGRDPLDCPLQVSGSISGQQVQYIGANSGVLIVDENANCLAGRFAIDFGDDTLDGWFSSAWQ